MKFVHILCMLAVSPCLADYRPDRDGAVTTVGLSVADTSGVPIPDAKVMFRVFTTFDDCDKLIRDTDANGYCEISAKTRGEITIVVTKEGFYTSYGTLEYRDMSWDESVKEHKWTRGVIKNKIAMKPVMRPRKLVSAGMLMKRPPATNAPLPFDVFLGDWCAPYGKGIRPDFMITCHETTNKVGVCVRGMSIRTENCVDGLLPRHIDQWSKFKYDLSADENAKYQREVSKGRFLDADGNSERAADLEDGRYLIFRIRTQTNEVGRVVRANYGTIGESLDFQGDLTLNIHVNPVANDTNIEHDWAYKNMKKGR